MTWIRRHFTLSLFVLLVRSLANGSTLERRKRFAESTLGLMKTEGCSRERERGWKRGEEHLCAFAVYRRELCGCFHVCELVARNGRALPEREAARTVEDNPPRRTKYRGRTRETRVCPDEMQFIRLHFAGRPRPEYIPRGEKGRKREGDLSAASRSRMHPLNLAIDSDRFNENK